MISGVSCRNPSGIPRRESRLFRSKRSEAGWCPKLGFDTVNHLSSVDIRQQRKREAANGEDLVGTGEWIDRTRLMVNVDDIEQLLLGLVPKSIFECTKRLLEKM